MVIVTKTYATARLQGGSLSASNVHVVSIDGWTIISHQNLLGCHNPMVWSVVHIVSIDGWTIIKPDYSSNIRLVVTILWSGLFQRPNKFSLYQHGYIISFNQYPVTFLTIQCVYVNSLETKS